ncbi:PHP domain-containing protein [Thermophilibacter mediterraneus]|uniref:PHP domain-containing protein n=1 Tax=Thermophilibacter mediterraneus TaxID=1871031 RepID=UPI003207A31C
MARPLDPGSIVDTHTHTHFSDGVGTFDQNAAAALAAGCRVLVSTDHLTLPRVMDPEGAVQVVESQLAEHRAAWEAARDAHPELEMIYGFECDWYPGCEPNVERWASGAQVLLGSVHWLGEQGDGAWIDDPTDQRIWRELGPDEVWRRYARTWCRACESPLPFATMAHPDLAMRFVNAGFAPTIDLAPLWDEMVACAHDTGRRVELSTAGWRKGVGDYYPACGLLERFCAAGVPITVGSDGHVPADICDGISGAYAHAWEVGYRAVEVPRADGSWESMPLR